MPLIPASLRARFQSWLNDRPDEDILRQLFIAMLVTAAAVLTADYLQLGHSTEQARAPAGEIAAPEVSGAPADNSDPLPADEPKPRTSPLQTADASPIARMSFQLMGDGRLMATGAIEPGVAKEFAAEVGKRGSYIKTVVLRSPGGSVSDAMDMGRLIRKNKFATEVEAGRYCTSSCPLVFASGVERRVGERSTIGVHQVYAMSRNGMTAAAGMADVQRMSAEVQKYLRDMGVDLAVWTRAMETPKETLYYFKRDELLGLKLATQVGNVAKPAIAEAQPRK